MTLRGRLAKLERWAQEEGLHDCPGCQRRLRGEIPMTTTNVPAGEPMPEPDRCPVCGVEWPRITMEFVGANTGETRYIVYSPLHYDPEFPAHRQAS